MKWMISLLVLAAAVFVPRAALAQEIAGRVLVAVGDVAIERGAQRIAARAGTEIRAGDLFQLGAQSNAQIRLSDESIVALRPDTTFRLTEYGFQNRKPDEQRAFFELVKGGMRTVTGIIGRLHQRNYGVVTPNATIGIRGTHYSLHQSNPLVGVVTDGAIEVETKAGKVTFGADQYFKVDSPNALPERTLTPPLQLRDAGAGRARATAAAATGQQQATTSTGGESATTVAQTGLGGGTGDTKISSGVTSAALPIEQTVTVFQSNASAATQGPATVVEPTFSGTVFYRVTGPFNISVACSNPPCSNFTAGDITLGVNFALQRASVSVNVMDTRGEILNVGTPFTSQGLPVTISGGQVTFSGTATLADNPQNTGAFRCSDCGPGPGGTPGFLTTMTVSGTISGSQATVTLSGVSQDGESGMFSVTLSSATPPNNDVAAIVTQNLGSGASARSAAFWGVQLDASRKLIDFGPSVGQIKANVGSATNTIAGSAPSAGNLVWGNWTGGGSQITDFNYATFTTNSSQTQPWITGTATNTVPPSLGVLTYTPIGWLINNGSGVLNSGSITADFVNRTVNLSLNASRTSGELNTFQMNGSSGFSSTSGRFSAGFTSVTCSGPCITGGNQIGGTFGGFFAGQNAEGAGVAFTAGYGPPPNGVSGVAAFKR